MPRRRESLEVSWLVTTLKRLASDWQAIGKRLANYGQESRKDQQNDCHNHLPSSISVGATFSAKSTTNFANCLTLIMYFGESESELMIFVHRATCSGCSFSSVCLSAGRSHRAAGARPVSDSLMPVSSFTFFRIFWISSSTFLIDRAYWPVP